MPIEPQFAYTFLKSCLHFFCCSSGHKSRKRSFAFQYYASTKMKRDTFSYGFKKSKCINYQGLSLYRNQAVSRRNQFKCYMITYFLSFKCLFFKSDQHTLYTYLIRWHTGLKKKKEKKKNKKAKMNLNCNQRKLKDPDCSMYMLQL